jgi:hypothetical protein
MLEPLEPKRQRALVAGLDCFAPQRQKRELLALSSLETLQALRLKLLEALLSLLLSGVGCVQLAGD